MYDFNYSKLGLIPFSFALRYDEELDRKSGFYLGRQKENIYQVDVRYQNVNIFSSDDFGFEIMDFLLGFACGKNLLLLQFQTISFQGDGFLRVNYLGNRMLPRSSANYTTKNLSLELSGSFDCNIRFELRSTSAFHISWPIPLLDFRWNKLIVEDPNIPIKDQDNYSTTFHLFDFDQKNVLRFGFTFFL